MKKLLFILIVFLITINSEIFAQGCVAIRSTGATCSMHMPDSVSSASKWQNRTQSVPDKNKTALTGVYAQGDAAFAYYVINVGFVIKL